MHLTKLSTKGQIIVPKAIRESRAWDAGTEFTVEESGDGILLRPVGKFDTAELNAVVGCLHYKGKAKTIAQMNEAVRRQVLRRHDSGRY